MWQDGQCLSGELLSAFGGGISLQMPALPLACGLQEVVSLLSFFSSLWACSQADTRSTVQGLVQSFVHPDR